MARVCALVAAVAFVGMRLADVMPYHFRDAGTLVRYSPLCLGIDLDGDTPGIRPVEEWPSGLFGDRSLGAVVDSDGRVIATEGDRVSVSATFIRQSSGDINPCDSVERLEIDGLEVIGHRSPTP